MPLTPRPPLPRRERGPGVVEVTGEDVMDSVLESLLIEARLAPGDDAPRLVLADWLEENGGEADRARGEFIRLQCQLAHARVADRSDMEWRERSLWWEYVE